MNASAHDFRWVGSEAVGLRAATAAVEADATLSVAVVRNDYSICGQTCVFSAEGKKAVRSSPRTELPPPFARIAHSRTQ